MLRFLQTFCFTISIALWFFFKLVLFPYSYSSRLHPFQCLFPYYLIFLLFLKLSFFLSLPFFSFPLFHFVLFPFVFSSLCFPSFYLPLPPLLFPIPLFYLAPRHSSFTLCIAFACHLHSLSLPIAYCSSVTFSFNDFSTRCIKKEPSSIFCSSVKIKKYPRRSLDTANYDTLT